MYGVAGVRHPLRLCSPHRHSSIDGGDKKTEIIFNHSLLEMAFIFRTNPVQQRENKKLKPPCPAHTGGGCPDMAGVMAD